MTSMTITVDRAHCINELEVRGRTMGHGHPGIISMFTLLDAASSLLVSMVSRWKRL
jgi:hypothetical protein